MRSLALLLMLAACSSQQKDSETDPIADGAGVDRHCRLAMRFAAQERCLAAGEQLAHCSGPLEAEARAQAESKCPPGRAIDPEPVPRVDPPPVSPPPPPVSPSPSPGPSPSPAPQPSTRPRPPPPFIIPSSVPIIPSVIPIPGLPPPAQPLDDRK